MMPQALSHLHALKKNVVSPECTKGDSGVHAAQYLHDDTYLNGTGQQMSAGLTCLRFTRADTSSAASTRAPTSNTGDMGK